MQYTLFSLLRKLGEVMSERSSKNHFVGYIQNGNCHFSMIDRESVVPTEELGDPSQLPPAKNTKLFPIRNSWFGIVRFGILRFCISRYDTVLFGIFQFGIV